MEAHLEKQVASNNCTHIFHCLEKMVSEPLMCDVDGSLSV